MIIVTWKVESSLNMLWLVYLTTQPGNYCYLGQYLNMCGCLYLGTSDLVTAQPGDYCYLGQCLNMSGCLYLGTSHLVSPTRWLLSPWTLLNMSGCLYLGTSHLVTAQPGDYCHLGPWWTCLAAYILVPHSPLKWTFVVTLDHAWTCLAAYIYLTDQPVDSDCCHLEVE